MRTSACCSLAPQSRCPPGSSKTGPARPLSRRSNACANRHHPKRSDRVGGKRRRISPEFASSLAGALANNIATQSPLSSHWQRLQGEIETERACGQKREPELSRQEMEAAEKAEGGR